MYSKISDKLNIKKEDLELFILWHKIGNDFLEWMSDMSQKFSNEEIIKSCSGWEETIKYWIIGDRFLSYRSKIYE